MGALGKRWTWKNHKCDCNGLGKCRLCLRRVYEKEKYQRKKEGGANRKAGRKRKCDCRSCKICKHREAVQRYNSKLKKRKFSKIKRYEWDRTTLVL